MPALTLAELKSVNRAAFDHYLRTGERLTCEEWLGRREAKFNPYHDELGRFTSALGVSVSYGNRSPVAPVRPKNGSVANAPASLPGPNRSPSQISRPAKPVQDTTSAQRRGKISREAAVLPAPQLGHRAQSVGSGQTELVEMPDLRVVLFGPGVTLKPVPVATLQEFDGAARLASRMQDLDAVITGPQFDVMAGSSGLHGQALIGGRVYGKSAPDRYYFGTVTGGDRVNRLTFGKGDPAGTAVDVGFGGGIPLLMNGRDVPGYNAAWNRYNQDSGTGKNIVAYNSVSNRTAIFVQPNGGKGHTLGAMRDYIRNSGYDYALAFDGSGSTSLNYRGQQLISPDMSRQPFIPLGIGFRAR